MKIPILAILQVCGNLSISMLCCTQSGYTQSETLLKLPSNASVSQVSWRDSIYRFPDFLDGRFTYVTGFSPEQTIKFNYNLYFGQIDFINSNGDTLQVTPSKELKVITIGGHLFFHDERKGYIEILVESPIALGVKTILNTERIDTESGGGEYHSQGEGNYTRSAGFVSSGPRANYKANREDYDFRGQPSPHDRYYRKTAAYFFIDRKNKLHNAVKPAILKLFSGSKKKINEYLLEYKIDFNSEYDLVRLLKFCSQLDQTPY